METTLETIPDIRLLWPLVAMVALVIVVTARMFIERIGEMKERRIHPQRVATQAQAATELTRTQSADHFRNLFEVPVLFYTGVLAALALDVRSDALVAIAWLFVAARYAHAVIHLSYNRVMHRFYAYLAGLASVAAFWGVLVWLASRA